jgi:hypothetical protein
LAINTFTDDNSNKLLGFNLGYQPSGLVSDLTLGVHGLGATVSAYADTGVPMSSAKLQLFGAYFRYDAADWEALGEYYRVGNSDVATGIRRFSNLWFAQVGRTFDSLKPYLRFERASLDPADNYFLSLQSGRSYKRAVAGLRYDLDTRSAVKLELNSTSESAVMQIDASGNPVPFADAKYRRAAVEYSIAF